MRDGTTWGTEECFAAAVGHEEYAAEWAGAELRRDWRGTVHRRRDVHADAWRSMARPM